MLRRRVLRVLLEVELHQVYILDVE